MRYLCPSSPFPASAISFYSCMMLPFLSRLSKLICQDSIFDSFALQSMTAHFLSATFQYFDRSKAYMSCEEFCYSWRKLRRLHYDMGMNYVEITVEVSTVKRSTDPQRVSQRSKMFISCAQMDFFPHLCRMYFPNVYLQMYIYIYNICSLPGFI